MATALLGQIGIVLARLLMPDSRLGTGGKANITLLNLVILFHIYNPAELNQTDQSLANHKNRPDVPGALAN